MELCIREVDDCAGVGTFRHSRVGGNPEIQAVKKRLDPRIREVDDCAVGTFRHSRVGGNPEIQAGKKRLDPRIREGDESAGRA